MIDIDIGQHEYEYELHILEYNIKYFFVFTDVRSYEVNGNSYRWGVLEILGAIQLSPGLLPIVPYTDQSESQWPWASGFKKQV